MEPSGLTVDDGNHFDRIPLRLSLDSFGSPTQWNPSSEGSDWESLQGDWEATSPLGLRPTLFEVRYKVEELSGSCVSEPRHLEGVLNDHKTEVERMEGILLKV